MRKASQSTGVQYGGAKGGGSKAESEPFDKVRIRPGESMLELGDRLGRERGLALSEDENGVLNAHSYTDNDGDDGGSAQLEEGKNILEARIIIKRPEHDGPEHLRGQNIATDQKYGREVSEISYKQDSSGGGGSGGGGGQQSPYMAMAERAGSPTDHKYRSGSEYVWDKKVMITAYITVQGWKEPGTGKLWKPWGWVTVKSFMAMVNEPLFVVEATFTQDNSSGTRTQLHLERLPFGGKPQDSGGGGGGGGGGAQQSSFTGGGGGGSTVPPAQSPQPQQENPEQAGTDQPKQKDEPLATGEETDATQGTEG
jgi:uncharacterized membrane protein YgcG